MEKGEVLIPKSYRIFEREDNEMIGNGREEFSIRNRSFSKVDAYFSQSISAAIYEHLNKNPDRIISVLDLAGGSESKAVKDIEKDINFSGRVKAVNVDLMQNINAGKGAKRIQGNALNLPLADSSVDIIYSRQFLPFVKRFRREHDLEIKKILSEVTRVLKPGGSAFLDDEEELSGDRSKDKREDLADDLGVVLESHDSIRTVLDKKFITRLWRNNTKPEKFLVLRKIK